MISIVIAVYDEEENIEELTNRIYASMKEPFELIYVVDGEDNTINILNKLKQPNMVIDYSRDRRGFKNAFITGFELAKGNRILTMDADINHMPEEIPRLLEVDADIVLGSRTVIKSIPLWKRWLSRTCNIIFRIYFGIKIKDKTNGLRLYKKQVLKNLYPNCKSDNFEILFEMLILAHRFNYKMVEVPTTLIHRRKGESKYTLLKAGVGYFKLMWRYVPFWW